MMSGKNRFRLIGASVALLVLCMLCVGITSCNHADGNAEVTTEPVADTTPETTQKEDTDMTEPETETVPTVTLTAEEAMYLDNIIADEATVMPVHPEGAIPAPMGVPTEEDGISLRIRVNAPFSGIRIAFPTYEKPGTYCTLSVYRWQKDYKTTVAEKPLLEISITDIVDSAQRDIPFGSQYDPGEYLFMVHSAGGPDDSRPYIWHYAPVGNNTGCGQLYYKGRRGNGDMQMWVLFDKTPLLPFGSMDTLYTYDVEATVKEKSDAVAAYRGLLANLAAFPTSFKIGDTQYHGFGEDFTELDRRVETTDLSETTTIRFSYQDTLELRLVSTLYPEHAAYEWTVYFTNTGDENSPTISEINGCDYTISAVNPHLCGIYGDGGYDHIPNMPYDINISGMNLEINNESGRSTYGRFPYFQLTHNTGGVFFAVGWPGQWRAGFDSWNGKVRVYDGQYLLDTYLLPGQTIRTPLSSFLFYEGSDQDRATNLWRSFYMDCNMRHPGGETFEPAVAANTSWMYAEMVYANEANQIDAIKKYHDNGIALDYYWMDAGWYYKTGTESLPDWLPTGTWYVDESRFPTKFRAISDYAHNLGTKTLLWFEPEVVRLNPELFGETSVREEWLLPKSGTKLIDYGNAEAREWLLNRVCTILEEGDIDLYRQDYGVAHPAGEWQANDPTGQIGITENLYVQGYLWFLDGIIARFPDMMIDACAAGGGRNDLETMRRAVPLHKSDGAYSQHDIKQSMNAALFSWFPYFGTVVSGPDVCHYVDRYGLRSSFCSFPVLGYNLNADLDWQTMKSCIDEWELIKDFYDDNYYPLTEWNRSDSEWTAWEFYDPESGNGFFEAFRPANAVEDTLLVKLKGLKGSATYKLTDTEGRFEATVSGYELKTAGYTITLPEAYSSAVVLIEEVS
jgi:alpha-galactosidase